MSKTKTALVFVLYTLMRHLSKCVTNTNANLLVGNILCFGYPERKKKQTFVFEIELNYGYNSQVITS